MKTIREWLQDLPDGYRELALANMLPDKANVEVPTLTDAIWHGMGEWIDTPQKGWFWSGVHDWSVGDKKYPLPPLPLPAEYTLSQAIERLGKEGFKVYNVDYFACNGNPYILGMQYDRWHVLAPSRWLDPKKNEFLQTAIEACNLLNGAKK
jgi:hypothetical protein